MPEVSAAIVAMTGAILVVAGAIPSTLTDASRQRIIGLGYLVGGLGIVSWLIAFAIAVVRLAKSI